MQQKLRKTYSIKKLSALEKGRACVSDFQVTNVMQKYRTA